MRLKDVKKLFIECFPDCSPTLERARDLREIRAVIMTRQILMAPRPAAGSKAPAQVPTGSFDFRLVSCGIDKISPIKLVRQVTNLGLKESKDLVDRCTAGPQTVMFSTDRARAEELARQFIGLGCTVEIAGSVVAA
jgi:large subunit ribosomal protein L7/L12